MTYRDRRYARAARLREWAEKREQKATAALDRVDSIAGMIPMGQPILVRHHSEGQHRRDIERIDNGMRKGMEHRQMAQSMTSRADNIEAAADYAIYSDDPDAIERLEGRIAVLVAESDRKKAYNKSCKAGSPDKSLLDDEQREWLTRTKRVAPWYFRKDGSIPPGNLAANINRLRKRIVELQAR